MGGFLTAPPRAEILVYYSQYGAISGSVVNSRSRVWLIAESTEPDAPLKAIVAINDPDTGRPVYQTFDVATAKIATQFQKSLSLVLADGTFLHHVVAPCVCGAGAIGYAGPTDERHIVQLLDPSNHVRIES
jgi:hypothetical protein